MKKIVFNVSLGLLLVFTSLSCQQDEARGNMYVEPIQIHITYDVFGNTKPFVEPITLQFANVTEQIALNYTTDLWGKVTLNELLPGEYTISVIGMLTAEQVSEVTGELASSEYNLGGFRSGVKLGLGTSYSIDIPVIAQPPSTLVFKELYYAGSRTSTNMTYRNDSFFSICNNSTSPISLSDIYIVNVENFGGIGATGPLWPGEAVGNYQHIYAQVMWKIVADASDRVLAPGEGVVIATMAAPHNKESLLNMNSPVDLSLADYEAYIVDPTNKYTDYPAPNMRMVFWPDYSHLWRLGVFGQGMALVQASKEEINSFVTVTLPQEFQDPFESEEYWLCKKIPNRFVIDAVDLVQNNTVSNTKRFHFSLDSGFATVGGTYLGYSVIRKHANVVNGVSFYKDTNNSTEDFEINVKPLSK